jgi:hypothetical protein
MEGSVSARKSTVLYKGLINLAPSIELLAVLKVGGWLEILQPANLEDRYHSDDLN